MVLAKGYIYDYETVVNCFIACFVNAQNSNDIVIFEVSDEINQIKEFISFLEQAIEKKTFLVSYNGLKFDNQVSRHILNNKTELLSLTSKDVYSYIYKGAQEIIKRSRDREFPMYHPNGNEFKECDILAINNYDNPAKMSSLKWLQYSMDWHNVEDMSKSFNKPHTSQDILLLKSYCINDCMSTKNLFIQNKSEILLRQNLSKHFNLPLDNHSEPKLAKSIFLKLLAEKMNISQIQLKQMKTYRKKIKLSEVILPYISFKTPVLKGTLSTFKRLVLDGENLKGSFKEEVTYRGLTLSFALGGIHGAKKGIYKSCKDFIIKSFDVTSYYPNLAIRNKWAPAHIPKEAFCEIYESFFEDRKLYPKSNPLNYVYKILLNATYGLSNEDNSFLKDSLFTMQITCNGQLLLVMLMEDICENIPGARPLMINTDGSEIIIPREYEAKYLEICEKWEKITSLNLEYEDYQKLIIGDVNNYIGIYKGKEIKEEEALSLIKQTPKPLIKKTKEGKFNHYKTKEKGRFEIDKALHKNKSYRVNRIALYNYFVHNKQPEITISENKNIFDYCAGVRMKGDWKLNATCVTDGSVIGTNLPKTLRYYIANKGCKFIKVKEIFTDGELTEVKNIKLEAQNCLEQEANRINPNKNFEEYNLNLSFYIKKIRKEINSLEPKHSQAAMNFYEI